MLCIIVLNFMQEEVFEVDSESESDHGCDHSHTNKRPRVQSTPKQPPLSVGRSSTNEREHSLPAYRYSRASIIQTAVGCSDN